MAPAPQGTGVVLFADLVGSTALQASLGDARYDEVRRTLFTALTVVVDSHHGAVVKTMGDGLMATFASAVAALEAGDGLVTAAGRTAARAGLGEPLELRVGGERRRPDP